MVESMIATRPTIFQRVMTLNRLARELNVSTTWLLAEAEAGRIPAVPAGKRNFVFNVKAVEKVLAERAAKGER